MKLPALFLIATIALATAQTDSIVDSTITKVDSVQLKNSSVQSDSTVNLAICPTKTASGWDRFWGYMYDRFELIPEIHIEADISGFTAHKNPDFNQRYLLESNTNLDIAIARYKEILYFNWLIEFCTGMGRNQGENVLFDPASIDYGIVPEFELRLKPFSIQTGLNHHCFHEIDQKVEPTIYWNRFYVGMGSHNRKAADYWKGVRDDSSWVAKNRWSWHGEIGGYWKEFGDVVSPDAINGANDRELEIHANFRATPFKTNYWLYNITSETLLGTWRNDSLAGGEADLFWQEKLGIELVLRKAKQGSLLFGDFYMDQMPMVENRERFSKDRLIEFGFRFFI